MKSRTKLLSSINKNVSKINKMLDKLDVLENRTPPDTRRVNIINNMKQKFPVDLALLKVDFTSLDYTVLNVALDETAVSLRNAVSLHHAAACAVADLTPQLSGTLRINNHKPDL